MRRYGHVLRKEDSDCVKKCMEYEVEGPRPRGRPKKTLTEIVEKDCQARKLNREDAMDYNRWRSRQGMTDDHDRCEWVNVSSGTSSPGLSWTKSVECVIPIMHTSKKVNIICCCLPATKHINDLDLKSNQYQRQKAARKKLAYSFMQQYSNLESN